MNLRVVRGRWSRFSLVPVGHGVVKAPGANVNSGLRILTHCEPMYQIWFAKAPYILVQ